MAEELPKQELLIKLLRMTTSPNDGEALVALRKATKLMDDAGWTWDKLIHSRITIIGDPFKGLGDPGFNQAKVAQPQATPVQATSKFQPKPAYSPGAGNIWQQSLGGNWYAVPDPMLQQPAPTIRTTHPIGRAANKFENPCYCCGKLVAVGGGFFFKPSEHHSRAPSSFQTICTSCNTTAAVGPSAAPRVGKGARKVTIDDLM